MKHSSKPVENSCESKTKVMHQKYYDYDKYY